MEALAHRLSSLLRGGSSHGHPWVVVRFRDLWDSGLQNTRSDKLELAMAEALESFGITSEGYLTLVSKYGYTVYLGGVEASDHDKIAKVLSELDRIVLPNPPKTADEPTGNP
jgi:hypothetical protein